MTARIKVTGAKEFENRLASARRDLPRELRAVVNKGANNIKTDWKLRWASGGRTKHIARSIKYDIHVSQKGLYVRGTVGPDKSAPAKAGPQARLAHFLEYGHEYPHMRGFSRPGGKPALAAEKPRFRKNLEDLTERLLRRGR